MADPALRKIVAALKTTLTGAAIGTVFIDRAEEEPFDRGQLPAVNIFSGAAVSFEAFDNGTTLHRLSIDIDLIEKSDATSIDERLAQMESKAVASLWAEQPPLAGLAQSAVPVSTAPAGAAYSDAAARTLSVEILFLTPIGDHFTIIGASGFVP